MTKKTQDLTSWYDQLLVKAKLICHGEVKGTVCFLNNSWGLWMEIQQLYNDAIANKNQLSAIALTKFQPTTSFCYQVFQVQLPTLSFYSEYQKEKTHIKGFNPELFLINQVGQKQLNDPLVLRPTSEIAFCNLWKKQELSYHDLPLIYNQWTQVFRAEKNTRPFLRNSEFYWQETHGLFVDQSQSEQAAISFWNLYQDLIINKLCIPAFVGLKSESEKFAGAKNTWTIEAIMPDGQSLQCATSHDLGDTFTKSFTISYQSKTNQKMTPSSFSCGMSTRILGAIFLTHSDDYGLVLPWYLASKQVKLYLFDKNNNPKTRALAFLVKNFLEKLKIRFSFIEINNQLGKQLLKGEIEGIPLQMIVDNEKTINIFNRLTRLKTSLTFANLQTEFVNLVNNYHTEMYRKANDLVEQKLARVQTLKEIEQAFKNKKAVLCTVKLTGELEQRLKTKYQVSVRCVFKKSDVTQNCPFTNQPCFDSVLIARAY
ncbi:proline--tRNA ligase [Mycoplasmoides genitalium]